MSGATVAGLGPADLGELNVDQYMNPYLRNVAQTQSDLMNQQNQQAMSGQLGNAIASGAAWGDRSGVALANLNQQQNLANAKILNDLLYQGYSNAQGVAAQQQGADLSARQANLARLMAGGQQLGELRKFGEMNWRPYETLIRQIEGGDVPINREMITPRDLARAKQLEPVFSHRLPIELAIELPIKNAGEKVMP